MVLLGNYQILHLYINLKNYNYFVFFSGIATGKSTVANIFKEQDIPLIDADVIARSSKPKL